MDELITQQPDSAELDPETEKARETQEVVRRDAPEPEERRRALVTLWQQRVQQDKTHWSNSFKRMRRSQQFARGHQWVEFARELDLVESEYVANVTLRHIQQRVAALYAKNPKAVARVRKRKLNTVWDGTAKSLQIAEQAVAVSTQPGTLTDPTVNQQALAVVQDHMNVATELKRLKNIAETLEILYQYNVDEQQQPFKLMMKSAVRRAITSGVAYIKPGFQRVTQMSPDAERAIGDMLSRLKTIERLAADLADGEIEEDTAEAEQLKVAIADLEQQGEVIVREGLTFDYPKSTAVIPSKSCVHLRTFAGASHVSEEFHLWPHEVQEIYGIDVGGSYREYVEPTLSTLDAKIEEALTQKNQEQDGNGIKPKKGKTCVWHVYNREDGLVYVICDGYPDFLREPAAPETWTENFWPWIPIVFNECDDENDIFPPSDVELIWDMQMELNRAREGLRQQRIANRPGYATAGGQLDDEDKHKLQTRPNNAVVELNALNEGQKVDDLLQALPAVAIDPALYDTNPAYEDIQRVIGSQEASLGGISGATATETSIAESSRMSALESNIDDLDDVLSQVARIGGQILLDNVTEATVQEIVGIGAVWPKMTRAEIARDIFLEVEAGSAGRPNQAQEIANFERLAPLLFQIPKLNPEKLAAEAIRRLDDRIDIQDMIDSDMPSIVAMNNQARPNQGPAASDPNAQGPEGGNNAENPPAPTGPAPSTPDPSQQADLFL